jgi:hypothetical protein
VNLGSKSAKPFFVQQGYHLVTVIAALGSPTAVTRATSTGAMWGYGNSSITMRDDKVAGWTDKGQLTSHFRARTVAKAVSKSSYARIHSSSTTTGSYYGQISEPRIVI